MNDRLRVTPRQAEVLVALIEAESPKLAAARLGISPWTLYHHVREAVRANGATHLTELVARHGAEILAGTETPRPTAATGESGRSF